MMNGATKNNGRILLRFDDICPTMKWDIWDEIEKCLTANSVRPILAVVPDNKDPKLTFEPARKDFWERVRGWQSMRWSIAMHGYQHLYVNHESGIMHRVLQSEFTGLPFVEQERKIRSSLEIFHRENVHVDLWVAPSHSFDVKTIRILLASGIKVISDGPWQYPFRDDHGMMWVPQTLFDLQSVPDGIQTVCFHHNKWGRGELDSFCRRLPQYVEQMTNLEDLIADCGADRLGLREAIRGRTILAKRLAKLAVKRIIRRIDPEWIGNSTA